MAPIWIFPNSHLQLVCQGATGVGLLPTGAQGGQRAPQQGVVPQPPDPTEVSRVMTPAGPITFQRASGRRGNRPGIKSVPGFPHSSWKQDQGQAQPPEHLRQGLKAPAWRSPRSVGVGRSQGRLARTLENNSCPQGPDTAQSPWDCNSRVELPAAKLP